MAGGVDAGYLHSASPCPWMQPACCLVTRLPRVVPRVLKGRHGQRRLVRAPKPGRNSSATLLIWHSRFACCLDHRCLATEPRVKRRACGPGGVLCRDLPSRIAHFAQCFDLSFSAAGGSFQGHPLPLPLPHPHRSGELQQAVTVTAVSHENKQIRSQRSGAG